MNEAKIRDGIAEAKLSETRILQALVSQLQKENDLLKGRERRSVGGDQ